MAAPGFRALIETHIEPVLVRAGFAPGQWACERGPADDPTCAATFCTGAGDYAARYPHLVPDGPEGARWVNPACVDILIEGSLGAGVTRLDVEAEGLDTLLGRTGAPATAGRVRRLRALRDPEPDAGGLAAILSDLYAAGVPPEGT